MNSVEDPATADHEHNHGGFPEYETWAQLFAFFPPQGLIIPQLS